MQQYSYSRLDLYDRCPWAYKLTHLDQIPREENPPQKLGKELHQKIEAYLSRLISRKYPTDWTWAAQQPASAEAQEVWERFYGRFTLPAAMEAPGVERKLAFTRTWEPCDFLAPEAFFRLVVDFHYRQNSLAVITDWKSGWVLPDSVEDSLQLRIYGWAICKAVYQDIQEVLLRLHFLRFGRDLEVLLTPADLQSVPQEIEARIAVIEADQTFAPRPGSFCDWCGLTAYCPVMAQALVPREIVAIATREQAQQAAELLLALREMDKFLTTRLKDWVQAHGPIPLGDLVFGPSESVTYSLDSQEVVQKLLAAGLERQSIWPLLSVSKSTLERALKKLKRRDLLKQILVQAPQKVADRFDFRKAASPKKRAA